MHFIWKVFFFRVCMRLLFFGIFVIIAQNNISVSQFRGSGGFVLNGTMIDRISYIVWNLWLREWGAAERTGEEGEKRIVGWIHNMSSKIFYICLRRCHRWSFSLLSPAYQTPPASPPPPHSLPLCIALTHSGPVRYTAKDNSYGYEV